MKHLEVVVTTLKKIIKNNNNMAYKNGFITIKYNDNTNLMVYIDAREISLYDKDREEYLNFYKSEGLDGLAFENQLYYKKEDVGVLKDYPFIKHLLIAQGNIKNLDAISHIDALEGLYIKNNSAGFNFDNIKYSLKYLSLSYHKGIVNLERLNHLNKLHIEKDTDKVQLPENIKSLELYKSKRTNLDFLSVFNDLNRLEIYSSNKLTDIKGILNCAKDITELEIERCKKIDDFLPILKLEKLRKLSIKLYDKEKITQLKELSYKLKDVDIIIYPSPKD